jgi:hypothetical protein
MHFHAVVWLDHLSALVLGFGAAGETTRTIVKNDGPAHIHHKAGSVGSGHVQEPAAYLAAIADALAGFREILILGPAETKTEFRSFLERNRPEVAKRVIGLEAMEQGSEGEILDHARHFFARADRMTPQL